MVKLTSSFVSLLLLACSFELTAAYKAPKISNDTDDDVNLSIVNGKITDYHMFPFISYLFARKDPSSIWGSACTGKLSLLSFKSCAPLFDVFEKVSFKYIKHANFIDFQFTASILNQNFIITAAHW